MRDNPATRTGKRHRHHLIIGHRLAHNPVEMDLFNTALITLRMRAIPGQRHFDSRATLLIKETSMSRLLTTLHHHTVRLTAAVFTAFSLSLPRSLGNRGLTNTPAKKGHHCLLHLTAPGSNYIIHSLPVPLRHSDRDGQTCCAVLI